MEIAVGLIAGFVVLAAGIPGILAVSYRAKELQRCHEAAERIAQEEYLNYRIHGQAGSGEDPPDRRKIMVYIRKKGERGNGYVFDLARGIRIGRDRQESDICLQDMSVSGNHCRICSYQNAAVIQDLGSSNGTVIKRGLRRISLYGRSEYLQNHDKILIGDVKLRVTVFFYDPIYM